MDDLPPPYSPPASLPHAAPPQVVLDRAPTLPPSYDAATATETPSGAGQRPVHAGLSPVLPVARAAQPRPRSFSSGHGAPSPGPLSVPSSPNSLLSRLSTLKPYKSNPLQPPQLAVPGSQAQQLSTRPTRSTRADEAKALASLFRMHHWRRSMSPLPTTMDEALYRSALLASEVHVRALLDMGAPILFTDRYAAIKTKKGSALHGALLGAAPHLAEVITQAFWGRVYAAALEEIVAGAQGPEDDLADAKARAATVADTKTQSLVDGRDKKGCTPLHVAAAAGATEAAQMLLRRGAELDAVDEIGRTPLHMAARYSRTEAAELFVDLGARTSHLMPSARGERDPNSLWFGAWADSERRADLGDYRFVTQFVAKLAAEAQKQAGGHDSKGEASLSTSGPGPSSPQHISFAGPLSVRGRLSRNRVGRSTSSAADDPYDLSLSSMSLKRRGPQDKWRQPGPSFLATPEYTSWRDGLDRLQTEHRAQRQRDKKAEVPDDMDFVDFT